MKTSVLKVGTKVGLVGGEAFIGTVDKVGYSLLNHEAMYKVSTGENNTITAKHSELSYEGDDCMYAAKDVYRLITNQQVSTTEMLLSEHATAEETHAKFLKIGGDARTTKHARVLELLVSIFGDNSKSSFTIFAFQAFASESHKRMTEVAFVSNLENNPKITEAVEGSEKSFIEHYDTIINLTASHLNDNVIMANYISQIDTASLPEDLRDELVVAFETFADYCKCCNTSQILAEKTMAYIDNKNNSTYETFKVKDTNLINLTPTQNLTDYDNVKIANLPHNLVKFVHELYNTKDVSLMADAARAILQIGIQFEAKCVDDLELTIPALSKLYNDFNCINKNGVEVEYVEKDPIPFIVDMSTPVGIILASEALTNSTVYTKYGSNIFLYTPKKDTDDFLRPVATADNF